MSRLSRDDIFQLATANGWVKGKELTNAQRNAIRIAMRQALSASDNAPTRVFDGTGTSRAMTTQEAVDNLLEELI